jgi:hypothetical protein
MIAYSIGQTLFCKQAEVIMSDPPFTEEQLLSIFDWYTVNCTELQYGEEYAMPDLDYVLELRRVDNAEEAYSFMKLTHLLHQIQGVADSPSRIPKIVQIMWRRSSGSYPLRSCSSQLLF